MPAIGDSMRTLLRSNCALASCARSCPSLTSCVRTCFSRSTSSRLRDPDVVLGAFEHFARRELLLPQLLLAFEILLRDGQLHARRLDALPRLFEPGLIGLQRGLAALDARAKRPRIDLHEELTQSDAVAFVDREIDDAPGRVGADVDEPLRLDLARRRHDSFEIAGADRLNGDSRRRRSARPPRVSAGRGDDEREPPGR